jgi:hypothetical protein
MHIDIETGRKEKHEINFFTLTIICGVIESSGREVLDFLANF